MKNSIIENMKNIGDVDCGVHYYRLKYLKRELHTHSLWDRQGRPLKTSPIFWEFWPSLPLVTHFTKYAYGVMAPFGRSPLPLSGWRHLWTSLLFSKPQVHISTYYSVLLFKFSSPLYTMSFEWHRDFVHYRPLSNLLKALNCKSLKRLPFTCV